MMSKLVIIAGPSAVGKTTVANYIVGQAPDAFEIVRSATTRAPRGDGNDAEYIYLSQDEFNAAIARGDMLEHTNYGGNLYGTPRSEVERVALAGKTPILILDLAGVASLRAANLDTEPCAVYIYEDIAVLERRLYARYLVPTPTPEGLASFVRRKEQNLADYNSAKDWVHLFDSFIQNRDIKEAAELVKVAINGKGLPPDPRVLIAFVENKK